MGVFLGITFMCLLVWNWFYQYEKEKLVRKAKKRREKIEKELLEKENRKEIEALQWKCSEPHCDNEVGEKWHSHCGSCYRMYKVWEELDNGRN